MGYLNGPADRFEHSNGIAENKLPSATEEHESEKDHYTNGDAVNENLLSVKKFETVVVRPTGKNPTPKGLYMLSNLDQTIPFPIEVVFAFERNSTNIEVGEVLKQSLGKVLDEYYPLAGGLDMNWDGKLVVDCDGGEGGVLFVEAFSDDEMAVAVGDITMIDQKVARKLVYSNHIPYETILDVPPLAVQVTTFKCGGIILGVRFNHVLMDGQGLTDFVTSWCQVAKGLPLSTHPHLDRSILSPRQPPKFDIPHPEYSKSRSPLIPLLGHKQEEKVIVTRSFCLTPTKLSQLRKLAMQKNNNNETISPAPTSFELISALAWICWTRARKVSPEKTSQIVTAIDGRAKFQPPMPRSYFGNGIAWSCAQSRARELTSEPFSYAVGIVRDAIKAVTEEYIRSAIDYHEVTRKPLEHENTLWITKWSRIPFYEIDFGWGEATQVAPASIMENLVVSLSQGKDSKNLVMSLSLPTEAMEIFQELMESELN
ncbi:hypothetical protein Pfo_014330 [Paulownia fortunei]|nr:hypothetical protein Pfo_014330 [Paulownia fortunei]